MQTRYVLQWLVALAMIGLTACGEEGSASPPTPIASNAYSANSGLDPTRFAHNQTPVVVSLALPAGSFVLSGKVIVGEGGNDAEQNAEITCYLFGSSIVAGALQGSSIIDMSSARLFGGPFAPGGSAVLSINGAATFASAANVVIECITTGTDGFAQFGQLQAIEVANLTVQPPPSRDQ